MEREGIRIRMRSNSIKKECYLTLKVSENILQNSILKRQKKKVNKKKKMQRQENSLLWAFPVKFIKVKGDQVVPLKSL